MFSKCNNSSNNSKEEIDKCIILYGLLDTTMMLASDINIKSKEDIIKIVRLYMNWWRIEEYFKFKI